MVLHPRSAFVLLYLAIVIYLLETTGDENLHSTVYVYYVWRIRIVWNVTQSQMIFASSFLTIAQRLLTVGRKEFMILDALYNFYFNYLYSPTQMKPFSRITSPFSFTSAAEAATKTSYAPFSATHAFCRSS